MYPASTTSSTECSSRSDRSLAAYASSSGKLPRGLPLTEAMAALKRAAARKGLKSCRSEIHFYRAFVDSVRRHGRVREMEFMTLYLARMKSPLLPLRFAPLGLKLMGKGKVPLQFPSRGQGKLAALFTKVETLEQATDNGEHP